MLIRCTALTALLASALCAQNAWIPPAVANGFEGSSSTGTLWSSGASATGTGTNMLQQMIYGKDTMPAGAMTITRLYWRANGSTLSTAGGVWSNVTIKMCTSANPHTAVSTTFASNLGPDLTTVYTGNVTVSPTTPGYPGVVYVDVPLTTPFFYAATGDLLVEVSFAAGSYLGGSVQTTDYQIPAGTPAARLYSTAAGATTGTLNTAAGIVLGFDYALVGGAATRIEYGTGCYDGALYELFSPAISFDLNNTGVRFTPNASGGYTVSAIPLNYVAPLSAGITTVTTGTLDDGLSEQTLPFTLAFPGGSTSIIRMCTNGFVWLDGTSTLTSLAPTSALLLTSPARLAPAWTDWNANPAGSGGGGTVHFDVDPSNSVAYCTWNGIGAYGYTATIGGPAFSTFQAQIHNSGVIEYHYVSVNNPYAIKQVLTGIKTNVGTVADGGSKDLSALLGNAIYVDDGLDAGLRLAASARPILGTSLDLVATNVAPTAMLTGFVLSLGSLPSGVELSSLGMPGCFQYLDLGLATTLGISFASPALQALSFPNDAAYTGMPIHAQAVSFVAGVNFLGGVSSNGVRLQLGTN